MALPIELQNFKAAGIYRLLYDKSQISNVDASILPLVVGYSEKGPFNTPVYIAGGDTATFINTFGNISKKLEKRGIFFHRLALQELNQGPILALNLKKFDGETVQASKISTVFNTKMGDPIDTTNLKVEDIYNTTRFWTLEPDKLNNLMSADGVRMNEYISLTETEANDPSVTYFIRKASGTNVAQYKVTVSDWYGADNIPDFLENKKHSLISDFFAEIYVFKGKFNSKQVLASSSLKNYFVISNKGNEKKLLLRPFVTNTYGEVEDTLDTLYNDPASNAIGHWVGCLIPQFTTKNGTYASLDIVFNQDSDKTGLMMSFNDDLLYEDSTVNIDLSGRDKIPTAEAERDVKISQLVNTSVTLSTLDAGTATTKLLGNIDAPVIVDHVKFGINVGTWQDDKFVPQTEFASDDTHVYGTLFVKNIDTDRNSITLQQAGDTEKTVVIKSPELVLSDYDMLTDMHNDVTIGDTLKDYKRTVEDNTETINDFIDHRGNFDEDGKIKEVGVLENYVKTVDGNIEKFSTVFESYSVKKNKEIKNNEEKNVIALAKLLGVKFDGLDNPIDKKGTYYTGNAFGEKNKPLDGPEKIITSISRLENTPINTEYTDIDENMSISMVDVNIEANTETSAKNVYGSSITFIDCGSNWKKIENYLTANKKSSIIINNADYSQNVLISDDYCDDSLLSTVQIGDCLIADNSTDGNYYDNCYVMDFGTEYDDNGDFKYHYIILSGTPMMYDNNTTTQIIRIDAPLNQEIGTMEPKYLEGYTYKNSAPNGSGMYAKLQWQHFILDTLSEYKGLRTGLLNKAEIDYRYIVDTFESYPELELKSRLSSLAKEKQNAFVISNFPAVKTFIKCPYTSFTDANGCFDVNYVVAGYNKKKSATIKFSLPSEVHGASYIAFYTPLKFSDGYIDTVVPSAGLVANLFVAKYSSRQPYYIVAGPNYGAINATNLVGPDYNYSQAELNVIEPFGVNCMVYRTNYGTFINANQTAKQTPKSALSKVNIVELCIYLQDQIENVLQAYQWEFNNETTRTAIKDKADTICSVIQANGGIQTYENVCDTTNNNDDVINNEMGVISTSIEPGYGMGKMVQELTVYSTGKLTASVKN